MWCWRILLYFVSYFICDFDIFENLILDIFYIIIDTIILD